LALLLSAGCEAPRTFSLEERVSRAITDTPQVQETNSSISADGKKIVFEAVVNDNKEIFLKDAGTGRLMNISNCPANDYQPSISADGRKVIFLSDRTGSPEIQMLDLVEMFYAKGLQSKQDGTVKAAISHFKGAVDTDPLHIPSHHQLGGIYDERREYDKAIEEFSIVADLYTKDFLISLPQVVQQNFKQELWALIRDTIAAHDNLALAYIHKGEKEAAAGVHYGLGMLFDRIEWNNFAITEFKKGMDIDSSTSADIYITF
jgi:tetratricopeptide (TPR) repeat protein